jgi:uncharacterized protein
VINRSVYLDALKSELETNIFYHSLSLEVCMAAIYDYLSQNGQLNSSAPNKSDWLLAGLLHDIDYSGEYKQDHPTKTAIVLAKHGLKVSETVLNIIKAHAPEITNRQPRNQAEWAAFCADSLTGLIVAVALIYPDKKLASVKTSSVIKRFIKEPRFASGTRRQEVSMCQNSDGLNIPLEKFIEICLIAMQSIAGNIGL